MSIASIDRLSSRALFFLAAFILFMVPFHAFFTTWLGSNFGHLDAIRLWSEWLLIFSAPAVIAQVAIHGKLRRAFLSNRLFQLGTLFVIVYFILGIVSLVHGSSNLDATLYSWIINLRFIFIFALFAVAAYSNPILEKLWPRLILIPASVVIVFGLMQKFLLDINFLRHFGYGPQTIPTYTTIDNHLNFRRIQSTLRGPNPLGAYLSVIVTYLVSKLNPRRYKQLALLIAGLVVMYFSYSRSAWLATLVAVFLLFIWKPFNNKRKLLLALIILIVAVCGLTFLISGRNTHLQETVLHSSTETLSPKTSNSIRVEETKKALNDIYNQPLGRGAGTAGPASFRNTGHPPRIAENYFLQIGQEAGVIGIALFVLVNIVVAKQLWLLRNKTLPKILLASLAGLTLINLLSHAWADDTLVYVWWGLAGIALAPSRLKDKNNTNEQ